MKDEDIIKIARGMEWLQAPHHPDLIDFASRLLAAAQEAHEPVAECVEDGCGGIFYRTLTNMAPVGKLYTHPAPIPEGMVLVPKEPTDAMRQAAWNVLRFYGEAVNLIYRSMIAAATDGKEAA